MHPISKKLLGWYRHNARALPWRINCDPYCILVSEFMLQQTRVETVIPYFQRWMKQFPNVHVLANAQEREVLKVWQGLGYYHRAINLHRTAKIIHIQHTSFPNTVLALKTLPGVGEYIARAVASIAFHVDTPAVDANAKRVLARLFNIEMPLNTKQSDREFFQLAQGLLPNGKAAEFNQALMDFGSLVCTSKSPRCTTCFLNKECIAFTQGVQNSRPIKKNRNAIPHYQVVAAVILHHRKVLIDQRREDGLLPNLWEFPGGKGEEGESMLAALQREIMEELGCEIKIQEQLGQYKHAYTHYKVTVQAYFCECTNQQPKPLQAREIKWVTIEALPEYPMGKVDRLIAHDLKGFFDKNMV